MPRVLWLCDFPPDGAAEKSMAQELLGILRREGGVNVKSVGPPVEVAAKPIPGTPGRIPLGGAGRRSGEAIESAMNGFNPDLVVSIGTGWLNGSHAGAIQRCDVPWAAVLDIDTPWRGGSWWRGVERTDAVAAFSEFGCEMLAASGREAALLSPAVNCRVYHPLRNGAAVREALRLNGRFVVGWTPTRYADLQLEPLVHAFARFSQGRPDVVLCIDGRVPGIADAALAAADTAGIRDGVKIWQDDGPHRSSAQFVKFCSLCDVMALPTPGEGTGSRILQTMACGVPVLATDCSLVREMLDGRGVLIEVKRRHMTPLLKGLAIPDPDSFVERLIELYESADLRATCSQRALAYAKEATWTRAMNGWLLLLGEMYGLQRSRLLPPLPSTPPSGRRFLLRRRIGLGDVLMSFVAAQALKEAEPDCHVTFETDKRFADFVRHNPCVDEVTTEPVAMSHSFAESFDFDGAHRFDFAHGYKHRERIDLILDMIHRSARGKRPQYEVTYAEQREARLALHAGGCRPGDELIGIVLSSAVRERARDTEVTNRLICDLLKDRPQARAVLIDRDRERSAQLQFTDAQREHVIDLTGTLSLPELAAVVNELHLVVTPDTGVLHVCGALGVPAVCFFNEVHPLTRIGYYENVVARQKPELCGNWPCSDARDCEFAQACINSVTYSEIRGDVAWLTAKGVSRKNERVHSPLVPQYGHRSPTAAMRTPDRSAHRAASGQKLRVLVQRRTGGLGDLIFALSAAEAVKAAHPGTRLYVQPAPQYAEFVSLFPCVDRVIRGETTQGDYVRTIDLDAFDPRYQGDRAIGMARSCDVAIDHLATPPALPSSVERAAQRLLGTEQNGNDLPEGAPLIALAPFGKQHPPGKSWSLEQLQEFLTLIPSGCRIILFDELPLDMETGSDVINLCGRTSLLEVMALLKRCRAFVGIDSGLLYAASLFGVPSIAFFSHIGAMDRMGLMREFVAIQPSLPCAPCGDLLDLSFPCVHAGTERAYQCMHCLAPPLVAEQLQRLLAGATNEDGPLREVINRDLEGHCTRWVLPPAGIPPLRDRTGVIVLNRNTWDECTRECVEDVLRNTTPPFEVVLVDNGSQPAEIARIKRQLPAEVRLVCNGENLGFPAGNNGGLDHLSADVRLVCFLNSDCFIREPGWNRRVWMLFNRDWRLAAVSLTQGEKAFFLDGETGADYFYDPEQGRSDCEIINGACFVMDRKKTGALRFDETFSPGYREDDDLSFQIREQGWSIAQLPDFNVIHLGHRTVSKMGDAVQYRGTSIPVSELLARNRERLMDKWQPMLHPRTDSDRDHASIAQFYKPKVSVIIPLSSERSDLWRNAVSAVQAQRMSDWEIVLVGGLQDRERLEERYGEASHVGIVTTEATFPGAKRNAGISAARGLYIAFLDDDDVWMPSHLDILCRYLDAHDQVDIVYTDAHHVQGRFENDETGIQSCFVAEEDLGHPWCRPFNAADYLQSGWINFPMVMMRAAVVDKVGPIDETLEYGEDWDFFSRTVRRGLRIEHVCSLQLLGKATYEYRKHAGSLTIAKDSAKWDADHETVQERNEENETTAVSRQL